LKAGREYFDFFEQDLETFYLNMSDLGFFETFGQSFNNFKGERVGLNYLIKRLYFNNFKWISSNEDLVKNSFTPKGNIEENPLLYKELGMQYVEPRKEISSKSPVVVKDLVTEFFKISSIQELLNTAN